MRVALLIIISNHPLTKTLVLIAAGLECLSSQRRMASARRHNIVLLELKGEASIWPLCVFSRH